VPIILKLSRFVCMKLRFLYRARKARWRDQRSEIEIALRHIRSGDAVVDVGAHKGAYLYWLRQAVGKDGKVYAYEPQTALADYLVSAVNVMKWANVFVHNLALSDTAGEQPLFVPGSGPSPGASLELPIAGKESYRTSNCRVDTLDQQLQHEAKISFVKVDVEGHELQVFRGAHQTISRHRPVLLFECEARHLATHDMQEVFAFLQKFDYEGSFFSPKGLRPIGEFEPSVHQRRVGERFWDAPGYCNNFLFTPAT